MDRYTQVGTALVGLAVVLFVAPALFPVQPVLYHDTHASSSLTPDQAQAEGVTVVHYENLSERGQTLYRTALESDGRHYVGQGSGAPEFSYPAEQERFAAMRNESGAIPGTVLVVRPRDDGDLPPAREYPDVDPEAIGAVNESGAVNETKVEQYRDRLRRFDTIETYRGPPPLGSVPQLLRLGAAVLAVVSLGGGGYLLALPPRDPES